MGPPRVWSSPFILSLAAGGLMCASFPPVGWPWLAWLAPVPWLWLVRGRGWTGRRPYVQIWLGAAVSWLVLLEGVRRAHPANYLGWFALSLYVASYQSAFVALTRAAVHGCRTPLLFAAPVVWSALEFARGYLLTGFSMALLGHAVAEWTWAIQIADLCGAYGVGFVMVFVASCLVTMLPGQDRKWQWWPAAAAFVALGTVSGYGLARMRTGIPPEAPPHLRAALLQGTRDKVFAPNPELDRKTLEQYWTLMRRARDGASALDLIVWPEAAFTSGVNAELLADGPVQAPRESGLTDSEFNKLLDDRRRAFSEYARQAAETANRVWRDGQFQTGQFQTANVHLLVGAESVAFHADATRLYNSVLLIDPQGSVVHRYNKVHPVMFGEYIPFGDILPWLYSLTPMRQGMARGDGPHLFEVRDVSICPSICFEITVPHLIRDQLNRLERQTGHAPDVLVNVTDDGWFWGSTILDLQLACGIFRAVEMRRPLLVAANTGISAWVDGNGRVVRRAAKRTEAIVFADVVKDRRLSWYRRWGDLPALVCAVLSLGWAIYGGRSLSRARSSAACGLGRGSQPPSLQPSTTA